MNVTALFLICACLRTLPVDSKIILSTYISGRDQISLSYSVESTLFLKTLGIWPTIAIAWMMIAPPLLSNRFCSFFTFFHTYFTSFVQSWHVRNLLFAFSFFSLKPTKGSVLLCIVPLPLWFWVYCTIDLHRWIVKINVRYFNHISRLHFANNFLLRTHTVKGYFFPQSFSFPTLSQSFDPESLLSCKFLRFFFTGLSTSFYASAIYHSLQKQEK